jgi:hypothetical protein
MSEVFTETIYQRQRIIFYFKYTKRRRIDSSTVLRDHVRRKNNNLYFHLGIGTAGIPGVALPEAVPA